MKKATNAAGTSHLEHIPNIGPRIADDLRLLGYEAPHQLQGEDPYAMYDRLCATTGVRHDSCVLDTFIAAVRFMDGGLPTPWWAFTAERKLELGAQTGNEVGAGRGKSRR